MEHYQRALDLSCNSDYCGACEEMHKAYYGMRTHPSFNKYLNDWDALVIKKNKLLRNRRRKHDMEINNLRRQIGSIESHYRGTLCTDSKGKMCFS